MSDGLNVTNAVPPICTRHSELMVLSFYDRPSSAPGNGYVCRSCAKERKMSDKWYVRVPLSAMDWLMGRGCEDFLPKSGQNGAYWWRSEFERRIKVGTVRDEPKLPPSEKAELQVSLLNEIGLTLTALAKEQVLAVRMFESLQRDMETLGLRQRDTMKRVEEQKKYTLEALQALEYYQKQRLAEQAETLKTYKLSLEGIQGSLVDLAHSLDVVGAPLATRLAQIEERLDKLKYERSTALENNMATLNKLVLSERSDRVIGKPRKAGKRPVRKAGKRLKTSKL